MFQFTAFLTVPMYWVKMTLRVGFPIRISGSKLVCQLPAAYRRLSRPSSPVIAKASTTCTYSLDPITSMSTRNQQTSGTVCCIRRNINLLISENLDSLVTQSKFLNDGHGHPFMSVSSTTLIRLYKLLKNNSRKRQDETPSTQRRCLKRGGKPKWWRLDGIEPTTPCLQSRCSPQLS